MDTTTHIVNVTQASNEDEFCTAVRGGVYTVFGFTALANFMVLCGSRETNRRLDLNSGWRTYYYTINKLWLVQRPIYIEITKIILFIIAIVVISMDQHHNSKALYIAWGIFDFFVLIYVFHCIASSSNNNVQFSYGTLIWLLGYTACIGVGYGTSLKISYDNDMENNVLYIDYGFWLIAGLIWRFQGDKPKFVCCAHLFDHQFFTFWMIQIGGIKLFHVVVTVLQQVGVISHCDSLLPFFFSFNAMLVSLFILREGSVLRNMPELVHATSVVVCCQGYCVDMINSPVVQLNASDALVVFFLVVIIINLVIAVLYDVAIYYKAFTSSTHQVTPVEDLQAEDGENDTMGTRNNNRNEQNMSVWTLKSETGSLVNDLKGEPLCCAICMGDLHTNSAVAKITVCGHYFHASCIRRSLRYVGEKCPMCRGPYKEENIQDVMCVKCLSNPFITQCNHGDDRHSNSDTAVASDETPSETALTNNESDDGLINTVN